MVIQIHYSIHRLQMGGMAFASNDTALEIHPDMVGQRHALPAPDTYIIVKEIWDDGLKFDLLYFESEEEHILHYGEHLSYKREGNAYGFSYEIDLR